MRKHSAIVNIVFNIADLIKLVGCGLLFLSNYDDFFITAFGSSLNWKRVGYLVSRVACEVVKNFAGFQVEQPHRAIAITDNRPFTWSQKMNK